MLEKYDSKHSEYEDRFLAIGSICGLVLMAVAYTDRAGITRIISARSATKAEKELYYDKINEYYVDNIYQLSIPFIKTHHSTPK